MPGVKANTQKKGGDDKKPGGGGAAGKAARTGPGEGAKVCVSCKATFNGRAPRTMLQEHMDSKHAKLTFEQCFPGYEE